jgi:hypothetical protein
MANPHWLLRILLFTILFTGHGTTMSADTTKFEWKASESAPKNFPMQIIRGNLHYHGDASGDGLYVPNGVVISHGWGRMRSSHITGPDLKPLPDKLDITFFSYMEDTFYQGSFDLPYDKILRLFRDGEARPKKKDRQGKDMKNDYRIIVGVAPGGTVAVWVTDEGSKEVFFGQAKKVELDFSKAIEMPVAKRTWYVNKNLEHAVPPDVLASIRKNGIPFQQWANYRTQYQWVPTFAVSHPPTEIGIGTFSAEGRHYNFPLEPAFTATSHPVPDEIEFQYAVKEGEAKDYYIIHFDETEMLTSFAKLGAHHKPLQLEFEPKLPKDQTLVRLRNDKETIQLKKFTVKKIGSS